jgi:hypothetical protein
MASQQRSIGNEMVKKIGHSLVRGRVFGQIFLICFLTINAEAVCTPIVSSGVVASMGIVKCVPVGGPAFKSQWDLVRENSLGGWGVQKITKLLRRNSLCFSSTHSDRWDCPAIGWWNPLNSQMQSHFDFFSSSASKILKLQNYTALRSAEKFSKIQNRRIEQDLSPLCKSESHFGNFGPLLGSVRRYFSGARLSKQSLQSCWLCYATSYGCTWRGLGFWRISPWLLLGFGFVSMLNPFSWR